MKNIKSIVLEKYKDATKFEMVDEHIYRQCSDGSYRIALSCDLEDGEDGQYPLEDLLNKYYLNCTDYFEDKQAKNARTLSFELEGSLDEEEENKENIFSFSKIIGKHVYNVECDGLIRLIIEPQ